MNKQQINIRFIALLAIVVFIGFWRIYSHREDAGALSNFTPIGALALFGGAYFNQKWKAYLLPILILFISDIVMMRLFYAEYSNGLLYDGWYWTYGSFGLMVLIGELIKRVSFKSVFFGMVSAAVVHWLIVDLGVWLGGGKDITTGLPYTRDLTGLIKCYVLAIPFMKSLFIGNVIFGTALFGGFELAQVKFPVLKLTH